MIWLAFIVGLLLGAMVSAWCIFIKKRDIHYHRYVEWYEIKQHRQKAIIFLQRQNNKYEINPN